MQTQPLEELESALDRVARRLVESKDPIPGAAQRVRRLEREPWWSLAWTAGLVAATVYSRQFLLAGGLLMLAIPAKVQRVRKRRDELDLLNSSSDLLAMEVKSLNERHRRLGTSAAFALWMGTLFAVVGGGFSPRPLMGLSAGVIALLVALFQLRILRPRLRRALADLGSEAEDHWSMHHMIVLVALFFPVFMLVAFVRSKLGAGEQDDESDSGPSTGSSGGPATDAPPADKREESDATRGDSQ